MAQHPKRRWESLDEAERDRLLDLASTIILSVTLVLTAFSAWESTLWNGEQAEAYARASSARTQSNGALIVASTQKAYDATSFSTGIVEFFRGDQAAVDFFRQRLLRDEFKQAVEAWIALDPENNPDAPDTPFEMPEYRNAKEEDSKALAATAESELTYGDAANEHGDNYVLVTVFFAAVLFFTGIVTKFKSDSIRFASLVMASIALVGATAFMLTLPRLFET
jgi:hypothetical protein